jgi:hypothetical protein
MTLFVITFTTAAEPSSVVIVTVGAGVAAGLMAVVRPVLTGL